MLYTIASADWSPGRPPPLVQGGLFRSRSKAGAIAGRPTLAVALRYDATRGVVVPEGPVARAEVGSWAAPAVVDVRGGVMVLAAIPAALVRVVGPAEVRADPGALRLFPRPHVTPKSPDIPLRPAPSPLHLGRDGKPVPSSGPREPSGPRPRPIPRPGRVVMRVLQGMVRPRRP